MSVYTRVPKQLDDTAFGLFAGEGGVIHLAKSYSDCKALSSLGGSIISEEKASKPANAMSIMNQSQPPKRLKIPTKFLEGENGMDKKNYLKEGGHCEGAKQSHISVGREMERSFQKSGKHDNQRSENCASLSGYSFDGSDNPEVSTDRNRPASKLIKDNQDLQKLFDSVRGKESHEQQPKQVGKLKLPTSFSLDRSHNEMQRDSENVRNEVHEEEPYGSMINETVAMTFDDWKNDENMIKGDYVSSNHYSANKGFHGRFETTFKQNNPPLNNPKIVWGNDASDVKATHTQKRNDAQNFWHIKQEQAIGSNEKAGYKENMKSKSKMFVNGVNLATSSSGELYSHSIDQLCNGKLNQSDSGKCNQAMNSFDMDERGDNKILKDKHTVNEEDVRSSKAAQENIDRRGFKTVGKLKLPTAFACNHDRKSQSTSGKKFQATYAEGKPNESDEMEQKVIFEKQAMIGEDQSSTKNTNICKQGWNSATKAWLSNSEEAETEVKKKSIFLESGKEGDKAIGTNEVKPIGKLDINSLFSQQIEKSPNEKKEESSAFSKTKAIFDQNSSNKGPTKQTSIGKLRMGSSRSERYEEIENLSPEGQVPSNMSNQMKEQLEKILQGRSESVSSQRSSSSSSSRRNENKEVGRLSLSSISSLETSFTSPRTNEDFSARTYDDDPFSTTSDYEDGEKASNNKVNKGNLEFQLGNIFQKKNTSEESVSSSAVSSLNTSLNAGEKKGVVNYSNVNVEDAESSSKRKILVDAIKEKHGNEMGAKENTENENCTKEIDGSFLNDCVQTENHNKSLNSVDFKSANDPSEERKPRSRGRVSIPNIFENQREKEKQTALSRNMRNVKLVGQEAAKGTIMMSQKSQSHMERDAEALVKIETSEKKNSKRNDGITSSIRTSYYTNRVNAPQSILGGQSSAGEKAISLANIDKGASLSMDLSSEKPMNHTVKRVNFHNGVGVISEDGSTENVQTRVTTAGKLSLSLIQSFEGGNTIRGRPGTPGRGYINQPKDIFDEARKEESQMSPILEEKTPTEGSTAAREGGTLKFDEVKDVSSQVQESQSEPTENSARANDKGGMLESTQEVRIEEASKRVVGKLSIPAMFK